MKEKNKRNNMISFHCLFLLLLLLMKKKKKIDSHHADHNKKKNKNTSDAMTSININNNKKHTPVPRIPFQCVHACVFFDDLHVLLLFLQRRHKSFQTQASHFLFFDCFCFSFSFTKKERKKEEGRINCGDHGIIVIE